MEETQPLNLPHQDRTLLLSNLGFDSSIISIRWGGVAGNSQMEGSSALACGRQKKAEKSRREHDQAGMIRFFSCWGGSTLEHQHAVLQDIIWLHALGANIALVHGGGPYITEWLQRLHIPTRFEHGLRVIDAQTLEVVRMVLCGQISQALVAMASQLGGQAVGLAGTDGNMVRCHKTNEQIGFVGEIETVDPMLVQQVLDDGFIPIIAPVGLAPDGTCLNMNADLVASQLAGALKADRLIFLSDVDGICGADGSLIPELNEA